GAPAPRPDRRGRLARVEASSSVCSGCLHWRPGVINLNPRSGPVRFPPANMSESFAELFEESLKSSVMKPGEVIIGEVVDANNEYVIVNAGLKSETEIPASEFKDINGELTVAVGDKVEVAIEALEDGHGNTRLSRDKARRAKAWKKLEQAFEDQSIVTGVLTGKVKGGFTVSI